VPQGNSPPPAGTASRQLGIFTVTVKDGVVTLTGLPETNEVGLQIVRRVRHVQGVVAVRDRLSCRPPGHSDRPLLARSSFSLDWCQNRYGKGR
jgi:BON domain